MSCQDPELKKACYDFAKNDGIEFGLSLLILMVALLWVAISKEANLDGIVDLTIFFAIVATMLLQIVARFAKSRIVNWAEDDVKLDTNYEKLAKRYPKITYSDGGESDPLIVCENGDSSVQSLSTLREHRGDDQKEWPRFRIPVVLDCELSGETKFYIEDSSDRFELPNEIREHYAELLGAHETSNVYNQLNVRVNSWAMEAGAFRMRTSRTTYFDSLVTNRAMDFVWTTGTTTRNQFQYGPFVPALRASSPLSNHLGFNGFVVSSDNCVPFIKRSKTVSIGKCTYGTSIGASLKTKYALNSQREFCAEGLKNAIIQEIKDELKIEPENLEDFSVEINIIAAYRDLVEGGKPQLLFYVRSRLSNNDIERSFMTAIGGGKAKKRWDVEAQELEDGAEMVWVSLDDIEKGAYCEDIAVFGDSVLHMMPSAVASVDLFRQFGLKACRENN